MMSLSVSDQFIKLKPHEQKMLIVAYENKNWEDLRNLSEMFGIITTDASIQLFLKYYTPEDKQSAYSQEEKSVNAANSKNNDKEEEMRSLFKQGKAIVTEKMQQSNKMQCNIDPILYLNVFKPVVITKTSKNKSKAKNKIIKQMDAEYKTKLSVLRSVDTDDLKKKFDLRFKMQQLFAELDVQIKKLKAKAQSKVEIDNKLLRSCKHGNQIRAKQSLASSLLLRQTWIKKLLKQIADEKQELMNEYLGLNIIEKIETKRNETNSNEQSKYCHWAAKNVLCPETSKMVPKNDVAFDNFIAMLKHMDEINDKLVEMEKEVNETVANTAFIKTWAKVRKLYEEDEKEKEKRRQKAKTKSKKSILGKRANDAAQSTKNANEAPPKKKQKKQIT